MKRTKVSFVEVVPDAKLLRKENRVNRALRGRFRKYGPVKLYRTRDGSVGVQFRSPVRLTPRKGGQIYRLIMTLLDPSK